MKKDILFLCQFFYPEHNSSATLPFDTASYLASKGYSVGALVGSPKEYSDGADYPPRETVDGVDIKRLKYIQLSRVGKLGRLINYFSFTAAALFHIGVLKNYKCVAVYSNPPVLPIVPILAKRLYGTRFVFVAYDIYPEVAYASGSVKKGSIIDRVMSYINKKLYKNASHIVALTDEMRSFLLDSRPQLDSDRISVIANWAHEKKCEVSQSAFERMGYDKDSFVISYFGNMGICQDMDTLMDAAVRLSRKDNIKFLIAGHGNKKDAVAQCIAENNLKNVKLLDFLTGRDFEDALAVSSCCVVSLEHGLMGTCAPSKYYSYLQCGRPVIAVCEEGSYLAEEVNREKIGAAVPVGEGALLAAVLKTLSDSPEECRAMGERAYELYSREYDIEVALGKYEKVFEKTVG